MIREYIIKISDEVMEEEIADRPQELIRCKECKFASYENGLNDDYKHCLLTGMMHKSTWFCADGGRKKASMTELEEIRTRCCRKLCKTEQMNEQEFEDYTSENCEDCPIGDLQQYYEKQIEELKKPFFNDGRGT